MPYLKNWLEREPNSLLFVCGPKSSGKTTLMTHLMDNHLDLKKMAINYMNLRGGLNLYPPEYCQKWPRFCKKL